MGLFTKGPMTVFLPRLPLLAIDWLFQYLTAADLSRLARALIRFDEEILSVLDRQWLRVFERHYGVDTRQFVRSGESSSCPSGLSLRRCWSLLAEVPRSLVSHEYPLPDGLAINKTTAVFQGVVEGSNFCVQSDIPFPCRSSAYVHRRLAKRHSKTWRIAPEVFQFASTAIMNVRRKAMALIDASARRCAGLPPISSCFRFVAPFVTKNGQWCLLPRSISYYEVTIEAAPEALFTPLAALIADGELVDCVAVGLATEGFSQSEMLPGWDRKSYGYHGDDGAIFHGRGRALKNFGPSFGVGDTVGCGLDLRQREIFFTLNGKFLGAPFRDVDPSLELYPTVGIDANATVRFNFGLDSPFAFCLEEMLLCGRG